MRLLASNGLPLALRLPSPGCDNPSVNRLAGVWDARATIYRAGGHHVAEHGPAQQPDGHRLGDVVRGDDQMGAARPPAPASPARPLPGVLAAAGATVQPVRAAALGGRPRLRPQQAPQTGHAAGSWQRGDAAALRREPDERAVRPHLPPVGNDPGRGLWRWLRAGVAVPSLARRRPRPFAGAALADQRLTHCCRRRGRGAGDVVPTSQRLPGRGPDAAGGGWHAASLLPDLANPSVARDVLQRGWRTGQVVDKLLLGNNPQSLLSGEPGIDKRAVWSGPRTIADVKQVGVDRTGNRSNQNIID